jgi:hypothetical protein
MILMEERLAQEMWVFFHQLFDLIRSGMPGSIRNKYAGLQIVRDGPSLTMESISTDLYLTISDNVCAEKNHLLSVLRNGIEFLARYLEDKPANNYNTYNNYNNNNNNNNNNTNKYRYTGYTSSCGLNYSR